MKVLLIACEFSGTVRDALKGNGYTIYHQVKTDGNCEAKRIREL